MSENKKIRLYEAVGDDSIRDSFYLGLTVENLIKKLYGLKFTISSHNKNVPFTAQIRSYREAVDNEGQSWLIKEISEEESVYTLKLQEIAYFLDYCMDTLAAPTFLPKIDGVYYRATKNVRNAMQIGSYNYLQDPFIKILACDLINRWLYFDEDRNPNNYLVLHNSRNDLFIVVIDYNKADLASPEMKITGMDDHFGWHRQEKTRFLTLLKPDNFANMSIDVFEGRLSDLMGIPKEKIKNICMTCFTGHLDKPEKTAALVTDNIISRRKYIDGYFRKWFIGKNNQKEQEETDRYSGMGKAFLDIYKKKK